MAFPAPLLLLEPASLDRFTFSPLGDRCLVAGLGTVRTLTTAAALAFVTELVAYGWEAIRPQPA